MNEELIEVRDLGDPIIGYYYRTDNSSLFIGLNFIGVEIDLEGDCYLVDREANEFVAYEFIQRNFEKETGLVRRIFDTSSICFCANSLLQFASKQKQILCDQEPPTRPPL